MLPYITVFGHDFPTYGLCMLIAAVVGLIFLRRRRAKYCNLTVDQFDYAYIWAIVGALLGAKILYWFTCIPQIFDDFSLLSTNPSLFISNYLTSGFVFYGGVVGGILAVLIYSKVAHCPFGEFIAGIIPAAPLVHAIGRVGCFLTGCCYGIPSETLGIVLKNSLTAPNDVALLPVQLFEAAGDLIIWGILTFYSRKRPHPYKILGVYLIAYPILRFTLEFFRYDSYRGFLLGLSTSQWFCIASVIVAVIIFIVTRGKTWNVAGCSADGDDSSCVFNDEDIKSDECSEDGPTVKESESDHTPAENNSDAESAETVSDDSSSEII